MTVGERAARTKPKTIMNKGSGLLVNRAEKATGPQGTKFLPVGRFRRLDNSAHDRYDRGCNKVGRNGGSLVLEAEANGLQGQTPPRVIHTSADLGSSRICYGLHKKQISPSSSLGPRL